MILYAGWRRASRRARLRSRYSPGRRYNNSAGIHYYLGTPGRSRKRPVVPGHQRQTRARARDVFRDTLKMDINRGPVGGGVVVVVDGERGSFGGSRKREGKGGRVGPGRIRDRPSRAKGTTNLIAAINSVLLYLQRRRRLRLLCPLIVSQEAAPPPPDSKVYRHQRGNNT